MVIRLSLDWNTYNSHSFAFASDVKEYSIINFYAESYNFMGWINLGFYFYNINLYIIPNIMI